MLGNPVQPVYGLNGLVGLIFVLAIAWIYATYSGAGYAHLYKCGGLIKTDSPIGC